MNRRKFLSGIARGIAGVVAGSIGIEMLAGCEGEIARLPVKTEEEGREVMRKAVEKLGGEIIAESEEGKPILVSFEVDNESYIVPVDMKVKFPERAWYDYTAFHSENDADTIWTDEEVKAAREYSKLEGEPNIAYHSHKEGLDERTLRREYMKNLSL